jgi:1-aminocyclopropane-1-carboxylate deaminase/D-cysteine desulfhydrase-like pyridoxal-dependent ACC family enzyme
MLFAIADEIWLQIANTAIAAAASTVVTVAGLIIGYMKLKRKLDAQDSDRSQSFDDMKKEIKTTAQDTAKEVEKVITEIKQVADTTLTESGRLKTIQLPK